MYTTTNSQDSDLLLRIPSISIMGSAVRQTPSSSSWSTFLIAFGAGTTVAVAWPILVQSWKRHNKQSNNCIYLDYNGTTPVYAQVFESMVPYFQHHYGNPSSGHAFGKEPRRAIDAARKQIFSHLLMGGKNQREEEKGKDNSNESSFSSSSSIWFTGCGTESDNLAIQLALQSTPKIHQKHIVTSNVEHPAIELYLKHLERTNMNVRVTYVPVDTDGRVSAQDIVAALRENTVLVTLMLANNESGALQPVQQVAQECRRRGILCHTDAAQAVGKVSITLADLGHPDMISIVGHKIGAPKGIAALYVRPGCLQEHDRELDHNHGIMLIGGGQEFGRRGGTEVCVEIDS
jgi:cysteine desulfurase